MLRLLRAAFALVGLVPLAASADLVVLSNGDHLSGTIASLSGGKLRFDSPSLGTLSIASEKIAAIHLERDARLVLADGRRLVGRIELRANGSLVLHDRGAEAPIAWADLAAIDPPEPASPAWRGSAASNLNFTRSNADTHVFNVDLDLKRRGPNEEIAVNAAYLYGQQTQPGTGETNTTQDSWTAQGQYSRFRSERFFGFASLRLERDGIVDLDLRSIAGGGAGWRLFARGKTELWLEAGLSHLREEFSGVSAARERISGQLSYRFRTELLRRLELAHDVAFFPTLDSPEDYFLTSRLTVRTPLADNLFANFRFVYDYDATPAPGSRNDTSKYTFGIGYRF